MLVALLALMIEASAEDTSLFAGVAVSDDLTIVKIVDAVNQHIHHNYGKGATGTARIPVLTIYSVYNLLLPDVKRYAGKKLAPLESHTSPDSRSKSLGDIEVRNSDKSPFEAVEVKHLKPVSVDMIRVAFRKIRNTTVNRYYILTTSEPNFDDQDAVLQKIAEYKKVHSCQIIVNGVMPSLKYYLRLVSNPQVFVDEYTKWLEHEYKRSSGIKKEHLRVWQDIRQQILKVK
jgi:DNA (cytosine-5)-methyltransferase 1